MTEIKDQGQKVRIEDQMHWATYDLDGQRIAQGQDMFTAPTESQLAEWDAMAPRLADALLATETTRVTSPASISYDRHDPDCLARQHGRSACMCEMAERIGR